MHDKDAARQQHMTKTWSPFNRKSKLRIVFYDDPWWKRLWARLCGQSLWHKVGAVKPQQFFVACAGEMYEGSDVIGVFTTEGEAVQRCHDTPRNDANRYDMWWVEMWEPGALQRTRGFAVDRPCPWHRAPQDYCPTCHPNVKGDNIL
jgi:hypothetical protein